MTFALISDIHGDAAALEAVLGDLARLGIDDGIVLGDVAQGGDEPAAVLDGLDERHLDRIRGFHATYARDELLAFHGSPRSFHDVLLPETEDVSPWRADGYRLLAGHTHTQWVRPLGDATYVNPGSVSIPYEWMVPPPSPKPFAAYAVVDDGSIEFRQCAR